MPEVVIKYKKPETLKILRGLAKYLDFKIAVNDGNGKDLDDILIQGDKTLDIKALEKIFTGKNLDAKELRSSMWKITE